MKGKRPKSPTPGALQYILQQRRNNSQIIFHNPHWNSVDCLSQLIWERSFTDCIEYLEKRGYFGEIAIFMLSYIQGGVA